MTHYLSLWSHFFFLVFLGFFFSPQRKQAIFACFILWEPMFAFTIHHILCSGSKASVVNSLSQNFGEVQLKLSSCLQFPEFAVKKKIIKMFICLQHSGMDSFLKQSQRLQTALLNNIIQDPCPHPHPCCQPSPPSFPSSQRRNKFLFLHRTLQLICNFPFHLLK